MSSARTRPVYRFQDNEQHIVLSKIFPTGEAVSLTVYYNEDRIPVPAMWAVNFDKLDEPTHRYALRYDKLGSRDQFVALEKALRKANLKLTQVGTIQRADSEIDKIQELLIEILTS